jgi:deazaflavin-dependent oxidoreductase (nitroreductase family)
MRNSLNTPDSWPNERNCYLTTIGRRTGSPHTVEIWFAASSDRRTLYILSGGRDRSDWVKNLLAHSAVRVKAGARTLLGHGRLVSDPAEEAQARSLVVRKYYGREFNPSGDWEVNSLPVAIDLSSDV